MPYSPSFQPSVTDLEAAIRDIQNQAIDSTSHEIESLMQKIIHVARSAREAILNHLSMAEVFYRVTYETVKRGAFLEDEIAHLMQEMDQKLRRSGLFGHPPFSVWSAHANLHL